MKRTYNIVWAWGPNQHATMRDLAVMINTRLEEGWQVTGGVCLVMTPEGYTATQAMMLEVSE